MWRRHRKRIVAFVGVSVVTAGLACAQVRSVKNFSTQDGLPSSEVFHILQDKSGFLWFSTSNGVAVFDGYEMEAYSIHDGIPDPLVLETREDDQGRIWMRSYSGRIAYYSNGLVHPYAFNDSLSEFSAMGFMEAFAQDTTGSWIFYESNDRAGRMQEDGSMRITKLTPMHVAITEHGKQLVIQNSMYRSDSVVTVLIDGKQFHVEIPFHDVKFHHNTHCVTRWDNDIYFTISNNVFRYDGQTVKLVYVAGAPIINLSTDQRGHLYVGHMNYGALRFKQKNFAQGDTLAFTKNLSVTDVLEDHEGGLWVSTIEAGVFYEPSTGIEHFQLPGDPRVKTALIHDNKILIGSYDGTLMALDEKTKKLLGSQKFDRTLLSLYAHNDTLFAGSATYLYILSRLGDPPVRKYAGSIQGFVEREHDVLALTGRNIIGYRYDGMRLFNSRHREKIRGVYVDDSLYYVMPHLGLIICDRNLKVRSESKNLKHLKISQLMPVDDSTFLLGTFGSGLLLADKTLTRIKKIESMPRDIYSLVKLAGTYYFASEQGIFSIRAEDLKNGTYRTYMLNARNGLLDNPIAFLKTSSDGKLLVFYDRAISVIDPQAINNLNFSPRFYLQQISVNNRRLSTQEHYQMPYDSNTVQLDFGFVSFNNQDISIRYRLNETDAWVYPRRANSINLYSLSPGFYRIELEYSADRFTWHKAEGLPTFKIQYPWWQNPYFFGGAFILLTAIGVVIVRNRLVIQRERNERLRLLTVQQQQLLDTEKQTTDRERNRIAKDLHDSVGSSLLATKLSVSRILKRYNHHESDEIEQQLATILNEIKGIIYDLSPTELERDGLSASVKQYIDRLSSVTDIQLHVAFYGEDVREGRIIIPIFRVLQELLSNSIKHSNGNSISLHINSFEKLLNIVYEDNGQGFSPQFFKGSGLGLNTIEARIGALNGQVKVDSGDYGTSYIIDVPKKSNKKV